VREFYDDIAASKAQEQLHRLQSHGESCAKDSENDSSSNNGEVKVTVLQFTQAFKREVPSSVDKDAWMTSHHKGSGSSSNTTSNNSNNNSNSNINSVAARTGPITSTSTLGGVSFHPSAASAVAAPPAVAEEREKVPHYRDISGTKRSIEVVDICSSSSDPDTCPGTGSDPVSTTAAPIALSAAAVPAAFVTPAERKAQSPSNPTFDYGATLVGMHTNYKYSVQNGSRDRSEGAVPVTNVKDALNNREQQQGTPENNDAANTNNCGGGGGEDEDELFYNAVVESDDAVAHQAQAQHPQTNKFHRFVLPQQATTSTSTSTSTPARTLAGAATTAVPAAGYGATAHLVSSTTTEEKQQQQFCEWAAPSEANAETEAMAETEAVPEGEMRTKDVPGASAASFSSSSSSSYSSAAKNATVVDAGVGVGASTKLNSPSFRRRFDPTPPVAQYAPSPMPPHDVAGIGIGRVVGAADHTLSASAVGATTSRMTSTGTHTRAELQSPVAGSGSGSGIGIGSGSGSECSSILSDEQKR
jgi:hypothetical protein